MYKRQIPDGKSNCKTLIKGFPKDIVEIKWSGHSVYNVLTALDQSGMVYVYQITLSQDKQTMEHKELANFACCDQAAAGINAHSTAAHAGRIMTFDYSEILEWLARICTHQLNF